MEREDVVKCIDALELMMAKGYKRYKVDAEITFEFFSTEELIARIRYFKDLLDEIDGVSRKGGKVKKRGFDS